MIKHITTYIPVPELTEAEAVLELHDLSQQIAYHDYLYFNKAAPEISDLAYDQMVVRNRQIEKRFPHLMRIDSPTLRIGAAPSAEFQKVRHSTPMLSLDNAFSEEDMELFFARARRFLKLPDTDDIPLMAELKIDGLSASLTYQKGQLILGTTRGDGIEGENITANLRTIRDIPLRLLGDHIPENLEIRGEVYLCKSDFQRLNQERLKNNEQPFANPRNAAAGSLRQLDPKITAIRPLRFFAYSISALSGLNLSTQAEILKHLESYGFSVNPHTQLCQNIKDIQQYFKRIQNIRQQLDYDIDGLVYKVNSLQLQKRLGSVGRAPRHSIAHKFMAEQCQTIVEDIHIQVGRTGVLTPVAHLKPVRIGGVMVARASLHNAQEIIRKDIRVGDTVVIQRAGDVIPQVVQVLTAQRPKNSFPFSFTQTCPSCGANVVQKNDQIAIYCPNAFECRAQAVQRLSHFISRDAFDIEGFGAKMVEKFYDMGLVKNPLDLFTLQQRDAQSLTPLKNQEGWGSQSASNLFHAIHAKRTISFDRFIYALGIPQVGLVTARALAAHYNTPDQLFHDACRLDNETSENYQKLFSKDGFGKAMIQDIADFFRDENNQDMYQQLATLIATTPYQAERVKGKLSGKTLVFTGSLDKMSRAEAKDIAEKMGAKIGSSISKNTDLVIMGKDAGSKLRAAQTLGIQVIDEDAWINLITH